MQFEPGMTAILKEPRTIMCLEGHFTIVKGKVVNNIGNVVHIKMSNGEHTSVGKNDLFPPSKLVNLLYGD